MKYTGKLYGKIAGRTFDTSKTGHDWDNIFNSLIELVEYLSPTKALMNDELRAMINRAERAIENYES